MEGAIVVKVRAAWSGHFSQGAQREEGRVLGRFRTRPKWWFVFAVRDSAGLRHAASGVFTQQLRSGTAAVRAMRPVGRFVARFSDRDQVSRLLMQDLQNVFQPEGLCRVDRCLQSQ